MVVVAVESNDEDSSTGSDEDDNRIQNGIMHHDHEEENGVEGHGDYDGLPSASSSSSSDASSSSSIFLAQGPLAEAGRPRAGTGASSRTSRRDSSSRDSNSSQRHHHRSHNNRHIAYDKSLPIQHSYLGSDLTELSGRVVLEDESVITIPLLSLPGVILVPGQTLPMQIQHPSLISMIRKIIHSNRTFGLTSSSTANESNRLGTTAEIRSFSLEDEEDDGITVLRMKAEGRQVFLIQETWRGIDGILMGRVKILPEADVIHPYKRNCLVSSYHGSKFNRQLLAVSTPLPSFVYNLYEPQRLMQKIMSHLEHWTIFDRGNNSNATPCGSSSSRASYNEDRTSRTSDSRRRYEVTTTMLRAASASSDNGLREEDFDEEDEQEVLEFEREVAPTAEELRETFVREAAEPVASSSSLESSCVPKNPVEFSYWVAGNLPLEDHHLLEFLSLTCHIQRLRWLLSILSRYLYISCSECKSKISKKDDVFSMSLQGPQGTYVNPSGYVHETITVYRAESLSLRDRPSTEFSWFPGYAWTVCDCSQCGSHIGWKFTTTKDKSLQPEFFWGLTRSAIELSFRSSSHHSGQPSHFRPTI